MDGHSLKIMESTSDDLISTTDLSSSSSTDSSQESLPSPGQSVAAAIGIDLGTTFSCAAIYLNGNSEVIPNKGGHRLTPSLIFYHPDSLEVSCGNAANDIAPQRLENFLFDMKRIIGRKYDDAYVQRLIESKGFTYKIIRGEDDRAEIELMHDGIKVQKSPEQACSEILKYLRESACEQHGDITEAVISVPAKFTGAQRKATKAAAELAGFRVLKLITEPVAAAIYYVKEKLKSNAKLLVFDFGGGTLDVSIIEVNGKSFEVKCVEGDTFLGGRDFDQALINYFMSDVKTKFGSKVMKPGLLRRIRRNCEKLKRYLSDNEKYTIPLDHIGGNEDITYPMSLSRRIFEDLTMELFEKAMHWVKECLKQAGLSKNDIDKVILVGGSTRIPKIRELLTLYFEGVTIQTEANPDLAVALGAAIQAGLINAKHEELECFKVTEVTPLSLGTNVCRGLMSKIIKRNTRLPTEETQKYTTASNDQSVCTIKIFEGERKNCDFNNLLGSFDITNLPPGKAGSVSIDVKFSLNEDGILDVSATENNTGVTNKLVVNVGNFHLCENKVTTMITDAENNKRDDDIFEKFVTYESQAEEYGNHVLYEIDKLDSPIKKIFIYKKWVEYINVSRELFYTEIDAMENSFKLLRNNIEPIIEGVISVKGHIPNEFIISEDVLFDLFTSKTSLTLEQLEQLFKKSDK